jgi:hypothetical protein
VYAPEKKIKECINFTAKWCPRVRLRLREGWEKRLSEDDIDVIAVTVDHPWNDIEFLSYESDFSFPE